MTRKWKSRSLTVPGFLRSVSRKIDGILDLHRVGIFIDSEYIRAEQQPDGRVRFKLTDIAKMQIATASQVPIPSSSFAILMEDTGFILTETGSHILLE